MNLEINSNLILERHRLKLTRYKISYLDEFSVEKRENTGAFHSMKDSGLSFRKFPVMNGKKIFVKEDNILPGIPILFFFCKFLTMQQFQDFLETFQGNFRTTSSSFEIWKVGNFGKFGRLVSALLQLNFRISRMNW